jgi:spindle assembly abnormal protein 6
MQVNKFKHLCHISLSFRPGNDAAIKQYLASRLTEVKGERENLRTSLESTSGRLETTVSSEAKLIKELSEHREQNSVVVGEMRNAQAALLNEAKHKALEELEEATQRFQSERSATVARHQEQTKSMEMRNSELDSQACPTP